MKYLRAILVAAGAAAAVVACSSAGTETSSGTAGASAASTTTTSTATASSTASSSSTAASSSSSSSSSSGTPVGTIGPNGGTLDTLTFAVVGDTRPPNEDDTSGYPTAVITQIWKDVEAASPRPAFAVTTGDYQYSNPYGTQSKPQLQAYLTARQAFSNIVFPVMGNHECTGYTASNCGQGNQDGITTNYTNFMSMMLAPIGQTSLPYYTFNVNGTNNAWTAKFVMVACNAWDGAQQTWLEGELSKPTTYTFVVRHEGNNATNAPCVTPMTSILSSHPLTLLIAGHTHTFEFDGSQRQMIVGNGGAPLSGQLNYGYVIAAQQPNGTINFDEYDYMTNQVVLNYNLSK